MAAAGAGARQVAFTATGSDSDGAADRNRNSRNSLSRALNYSRSRSQSHADAAAAMERGAEKYHLFLSHSWKFGQDTVQVLQKDLREYVPGIALFVDVQVDFNIDDLEEHVEAARW